MDSGSGNQHLVQDQLAMDGHRGTEHAHWRCCTNAGGWSGDQFWSRGNFELELAGNGVSTTKGVEIQLLLLALSTYASINKIEHYLLLEENRTSPFKVTNFCLWFEPAV